jgi:hypothetical protein
MRIDRILACVCIAVIAVLTPVAANAQRHVVTLKTDAGDEFDLDTSEAPDLTEWAEKELAPVVQQWYPRIVKMLPSEGFTAPRSFRIAFSASDRGVAATRGTAIECSAHWFRNNLKGEAKGAVVHELVHVAQQYGRARRGGARRPQTPGWLVEGVADYIRWFLYEPESRGAEINARRVAEVRYDDSYRVSANFLNWVTEHHDRDIVCKLNAALREGRYRDDIWSDSTNLSLEQLGDKWKLDLERSLGVVAAESASAASTKNSSNQPPINSLTDEEKSDGWRLLFNGNDLAGWHNFGRDKIRPGWQVKNGTLACVNPRDAGDLCTDDQFDWFELKLEYNIAQGGNSGIMYRVTNDGSYPWETGPELQLEDNALARDSVRSGWLYALYQPPDDPKTGKPLDATKPAGQWNEVRLLVSPEKCLHELNGVKYFEYALGSDAFQERVAKSKFRDMPLFAKAPRGHVALQGDHGQISFRRIRIRPIEQSPASAIQSDKR